MNSNFMMADTMSVIFVAINVLAISGWALLIFASGTRVAQRLVRNLALPIVLAVIYGGLLVNEVGFGAASGNGGFTSLEKVMVLFEAPNGALLAWSHFLVFDLFVGIWMVDLAQRAGAGALRLAPALVLTMLFGPVGFLNFMVAVPHRRLDA